MSGPSHSTLSTTQPSLTSSSASVASGSQPLRWSLQNFPVPLQLQARIPRSPLSVAQELLPNFPSHLTQQYDFDDSHHQQPQQYQLSLQQHIQQQLQQQFQRQLQLNLQGGGESSRLVMPDPPDTILDIDLQGGTAGAEGNYGPSVTNVSSNNSGPRGSLNSTHLLEALLRSAQGASSAYQRNSSSGGLLSQGASAGVTSYTHSHSHGHHHHNHYNAHSHNYARDESEVDGSTSPASNGNSNGASGSGMTLGANGGAPGVARNGDGPNVAGLQQGTELTLLYRWVAESGIFILLLFLHFLYDHRLGLLVFLCLGGTFYYTNMKLVHAIHQSAVRGQFYSPQEQNRSWLGLLNLMWLCGFLSVNIVILYYVFSDQRLWRLLFFQMAMVPDISVWTLLWCVVMTDYILKFLTVIFKSILAMLHPCCKNYRQRGKYYLLMESISQLYRQLVTVVPWLYYLNDSTRTSLWFAFITEAVYLGFKGWSVWGAVQFLYSSFQRFQSNTSFGSKPNSSDMLERGNQCPICQDTVNEPVMLPCKHIFCEQCVSIWFDREKTCPMCRAEITTESPMWKDGNTSSHLQWH